MAEKNRLKPRAWGFMYIERLLFKRFKMSFFNSFIHGDKLTEFLIEGHNPDARQKLLSADVDALRQQIQIGEVVHAYLVGRIVSSGRGVWALTDQNLLIRNTTRQGVECIPISQIKRFEAVRGGYGHTVRCFTSGRQFSMYGVDAELSKSMQLALNHLGVSTEFDDRPARGTLWTAFSGPLPSKEDCLADARQRLMTI